MQLTATTQRRDEYATLDLSVLMMTLEEFIRACISLRYRRVVAPSRFTLLLAWDVADAFPPLSPTPQYAPA